MTLRDQARRVVASVPGELRDRLRDSPLDALAWAGLTVRAVHALGSRRGAGGMCDGMSFTAHGTVLYAPTDNRRENFTLAHEYAHVLLDDDETVLIWLADQPDRDDVLERLCDEVAALLLVPDTLLGVVVGDHPPTGEHVLDLFRRSQASQVVCAIAVGRRLNSPGAVLLTDRTTRTVVHSAIVGEPPVHPRTGQPVPDSHPLLRIVPGQHLRRRTFWATPWGERRTMYLDAVATDKRAYGVLAQDDLWQIDKFHPPEPEPDASGPPSNHMSCRCGYAGVRTGWPCPDCGRPFCPRCQACDCEGRRSLTARCEGCFCDTPPRDLEEGRCSNCR